LVEKSSRDLRHRDRFVEKIDEAQFGDSIPNPPSSTDQFAAAEGGMGDSLGARDSL
jgi:hypothetical protein